MVIRSREALTAISHVCRSTFRAVGCWITDGEKFLAATRATPDGNAGDYCYNTGDTREGREQVVFVPNSPTCGRQTDENGHEEKEILPSWQLLSAIAHDVQTIVVPSQDASRAGAVVRRKPLTNAFSEGVPWVRCGAWLGSWFISKR